MRSCDVCAASLEGMHPKRRFCSDACRKRSKRQPGPPAPTPTPCTKVSDALLLELQELGMVDKYEAQLAMGLAAQLDDGSVRGAGYVSLSKELDRRVDALRLKAERPDDPARLISAAIADKRAHLRSA